MVISKDSKEQHKWQYLMYPIRLARGQRHERRFECLLVETRKDRDFLVAG